MAIIPLKSVMVKYGNWCQYGTEEIAAAMLKAARSKKIDALVLDIDSGGGSVDSIPPMLEAIQKVQTIYNKPVIACGDLVCIGSIFCCIALRPDNCREQLIVGIWKHRRYDVVLGYTALL